MLCEPLVASDIVPNTPIGCGYVPYPTSVIGSLWDDPTLAINHEDNPKTLSAHIR